jgi:hypothetical protein
MPGWVKTGGRHFVHSRPARFDGRPIRDYVPLFVERRARLELSTLG